MHLVLSSQQKGFKCLSKCRRVFISKDVVFLMHTFPFSDMFHYNPTSPYHPNY